MAEKDYLKDEKKALKLAIKTEQEIRKYYLENAEKMKNPVAKKTFVFLADEELKHIDAIKEFEKSIHEGTTPMIEQESEDQAMQRVKEFFKKSLEPKASQARADEDEIKVYEAGMVMEIKGHDFYEDAAKKSEHPNVKKLFEFLVKEENSHYALLSNALNYLKSPEEFFQDQEGWFFEAG